jgi:protein SCO1/2
MRFPNLRLQTTNHRAKLFFLGLLTAVLTACSDPADFVGSDISSGDIGQGWTLTDHQGEARQADSFPGKASVVFFGFTQCPDICPAALAEVATALQIMGEQAKDVQVLMITVDPERDTPPLLGEYLAAFDQGLPTRFLGLRGTPEELRKTASAFRAYYAKSPTPDGSYTMDHSASFYLFDPNGKARVLLSNQAGPHALAQDLKALLN